MNFGHLATSFQRGLDLIAVDRLRQVVGAPHLHSFHGRGDASVPRQHQNLRRSQHFLELRNESEPVLVRHLEIDRDICWQSR